VEWGVAKKKHYKEYKKKCLTELRGRAKKIQNVKYNKNSHTARVGSSKENTQYRRQ
jgi:hypothetical protein